MQTSRRSQRENLYAMSSLTWLRILRFIIIRSANRRTICVCVHYVTLVGRRYANQFAKSADGPRCRELSHLVVEFAEDEMSYGHYLTRYASSEIRDLGPCSADPCSMVLCDFRELAMRSLVAEVLNSCLAKTVRIIALKRSSQFGRTG